MTARNTPPKRTPQQAPIANDLLGETAAAATSQTPLATTPASTPQAPAWIALFNQGNAHWRTKDWAQAAHCYQQAMALLPTPKASDVAPAKTYAAASQQAPTLDDTQLWLMCAQASARCAVKLNALPQAREAYARLLRADPTRVQAWLECAELCEQLGGLEQQLMCLQRALALEPNDWRTHMQLCKTHLGLGQPDQAAVAVWAACQCDGAEPLGIYRFASDAALRFGHLSFALNQLSLLVNIKPVAPKTYVYAGDALMKLGANALAHQAFEKASAATDMATLTDLATALVSHNDWLGAQAALERASALHPKDWAAVVNLAKLHLDQWQVSKAQTILTRAQQLHGGTNDVIDALQLKINERSGSIDQAATSYAEQAATLGPWSHQASAACMASLYADQRSAQQCADLAKDLFLPLASAARTVALANVAQASKRIKLGYVTADLFRQHPVNLFMQPVLKAHDSSEFHISVYYAGDMMDEQTRLAKANCDQWVDIGRLSGDSVVQRIIADGIDVLIDLSGHTNHSKAKLFTKRLAPVQISYLGYPFTTGLPQMDYIIGDDIVIPPNNERFYTERVLRLPNAVFCYAPSQDYPLPTLDQQWLQRHTRYGYFGNLNKVSPATVSLWAAVMRADPQCRLRLKSPSFVDPGTRKRIEQAFQAHAIAPNQLELTGPSELGDMMAEYADIDVVLDSVPYNGGTTTLQAIWMGCPVVTLIGQGFYQRMGASGVHAAGHPEWVANNEQEFVAIAHQLVASRQRLRTIKKALRDDYQHSAAGNATQYTRDLEQLYRQCWQQWCATQPNSSI